MTPSSKHPSETEYSSDLTNGFNYEIRRLTGWMRYCCMVVFKWYFLQMREKWMKESKKRGEEWECWVPPKGVPSLPPSERLLKAFIVCSRMLICDSTGGAVFLFLSLFFLCMSYSIQFPYLYHHLIISAEQTGREKERWGERFEEKKRQGESCQAVTRLCMEWPKDSKAACSV